VLRALPARRTELRYGLALASLAGLLLAGLVTWSVLDLAVPGNSKVPRPSAALVAASPSENLASAPRPVPATVTPGPGEGLESPALVQPATSPPWVAWGAMIWLLGSLVMSCRLLVQWVDLQRVHGRCRPVSESGVKEIAARLGQTMHLKREVEILTGDHVASPAVFGVLRPMLLLPPALLVGIPVEQLEAIIAHELGHIRRHDYLINLAQQLLESLLFFNPVVWWLNRQIRIEREACCDRLAVEVTGKPNAYAWSLTRWAEEQRRSTAVLAPAFGAPRNSGGPLDRLKRLLLAEYRPVVRLPWYSFTSVLVVSGILLIGMWQGTHLAVSFAAELLTPAQRVQKLVEIGKEYGQENHVDTEGRSQAEALVSGTVRSGNGSPVTEDAIVCMYVNNGPSSVITGISCQHGRFTSRVKTGRLYLGISARGCAPAFVGPYRLESDKPLENLDLTLQPGFTARVRVTDEGGRPISGVEIAGNYVHAANSYTRFTLKTGADGTGLLDHAATNAVHLEATAAGYEYDERDGVALKSGGEFLWVLKPARPTPGIVVARQTGQPIAEARVVMIAREGLFAGNWSEPESAPLLAKTDAMGKFALTCLNARSTYSVLVMAPGYAGEVVRGISAGQAVLNIALGAELTVKGRVRGDLTKLGTGAPVLRVTTTLRMPVNQSRTYSPSNYFIEVRDGVGYFAFTNMLPASLVLSVGDVRKELELIQPINDLVLELDEKQPAPARPAVPRREVVIKLQAPPALPVPTGTLVYGFSSDADPRSHSTRIELTNGMARVSIPAPGRIAIEAATLPGYWSRALYQPIPPGAEPYELVLEALPAGAIFGRVVDVDGSDIGNVLVSVVEIEKSPLKSDATSLGVQVKSSASPGDAPTLFAAQPLPLGGKYALVAHRDRTYAVSETIALTEAQPIRQLVVRMAPGIRVEGRVVDQAKKPVAGAPLSLSYELPSGSFSSEAVRTDSEGRFAIEGVNPNVPGSYTMVKSISASSHC
jgi:hypothetical protein